MDRKSKILVNFGYAKLDTGKLDFIKIKGTEQNSQNTKYKQLCKNIHSKEPEQFMAINADYAWLSRNIIKAKAQ